MKKYIKVIMLSVVIVFVLNSLLFSVLTVVQAPYYDEAPAEVDSIYELYASEVYNEVVYRGATEYVSDETEIKKIDDVFKSSSIIKLNKIKSYFKMLSLGKEDFVFITFTKNYGDRSVAAKNIVASHIIVYFDNNEVYIACIELMEYAPDTSRIAMYKVNDNEELVKLLSEYKTEKNKGWKPILPEWRADVSEFHESFNGRQYILLFIIEFIVSVAVVNKFFAKQDNKNKQSYKKPKQ